MSFVSKDLLLEHKAVAHGLTQRQKSDGKLKMKTGKNPKKLRPYIISLGGGLPLDHYTEKNLKFSSFHCCFKRKVSI